LRIADAIVDLNMVGGKVYVTGRHRQWRLG
jgi:hypothetical protein